jgi:hypothetical protein
MLYGSDQTTCHSLPEEEPQATPNTVPVSYLLFFHIFLADPNNSVLIGPPQSIVCWKKLKRGGSTDQLGTLKLFMDRN